MAEFEKEKREHPTLPDSIIRQIVADHERMKQLRSPSQALAQECIKLSCPIKEAIKRRSL